MERDGDAENRLPGNTIIGGNHGRVFIKKERQNFWKSDYIKVGFPRQSENAKRFALSSSFFVSAFVNHKQVENLPLTPVLPGCKVGGNPP